MVKKFLLTLVVLSTLHAADYEHNCLRCHANGYQLNMFIKKYTLKYSSERSVKEEIFKYLKNPSFEKSVLPYGFLNRFGIKEKSPLSDKELREMLGIYYDEYNMKSRIY